MKNKLDLLEIIDLEVNFHLDEGLVKALKGVSFSLGTNETLGVIGESGSGKSVTAQSILGILPQPPSIIRKGEILYDNGKEQLNLLELDEESYRKIKWKDISIIFQEPMSSFSPLHSIGDQISDYNASINSNCFSIIMNSDNDLLKKNNKKLLISTNNQTKVIGTINKFYNSHDL